MSTTSATIHIVSKKMIKPCTPTPQNLNIYKISLTDQLVLTTNVPIILFYSSSSPNSSNDLMRTNHLQQSLANILPRFYPLAGRYVRKDHFVLCNDEGVEFVEARACPDNSFKNISEYVRSGAHEQLNNMLLPRLYCEADEVTDPIVSIQVTRFCCGGVAIGLSVSHRIVDADSISTFICAWAEEANNPSFESKCNINPRFDSPTLLPFKKLFPGSENIQLPRTVDPNIIAKRFSFNKDMIEALKAKIRDRSRRVSKVGVVCALISKAMIHMDPLKYGRFRNYLFGQVVNIRDRTIPPFPKHSCGNLVAMATRKLCPSNSKEVDVGFEDLVSFLRDAIDEVIADCACIFDEGHNSSILYDPFMDLTQTIMSGSEETKVISFSDWSKFKFYQTDFGWGKPIWTSIATMPVNNFVVLMGNKEGDGVEAWVHLFKEDMVWFEQAIDEEANTY